MSRPFIVAGWLAAASVGRLSAQVVDTTRADSLRADTTDYTALFLKSQQDAKRLIPVVPRIGAGTLLPAFGRLVLDRDSIVWHGAETVSDLLTRVPGVYLLRGGWPGRPELPAYQARGATAVTYLLDGIPYLAMGEDSVMVDPSTLPLSFIERVEIERLPGQLRVWLFTRRNDRAAPYSRIGISSGDARIARYQGLLEKRSTKGPGVGLAFDHLSVPLAGESETGSYENTQAWIRLEYLRNAHAGAELQFFRNSPDREAILSGDDTLSRQRRYSRSDLSGRVFLAPGNAGLGPRLDLVASRSSLHDEVEQDPDTVITDRRDDEGNVVGQDTTVNLTPHRRAVTQLGALASYRLGNASLDASFWWRSTWTPLDLRARGGFSPVSPIAISLEAAWLSHDGSRSSKWVTARAGLTLPFGFEAGAVWRRGDEVARPAVLDDESQSVDDRSVLLSFRRSFLELEGSFTTNAGFRPAGYAQYPGLVTIAPSGRTDWLSVSGRISPRQWLSLGGWFSTPRIVRPEGQPPNHLLLNATIQSKFLPTFKSGIFNLRMQASIERWGRAVLGQDSTGAPTALEPATFLRGYLGIQIGSFMAYIDWYNFRGSPKFYVPGLPIPSYAQTFGVRWEFSN